MRILLLLAACGCCSSLTQAADRVTVATLNCEFLSTPMVHMKFGLPIFEDDWTDEQRAAWAMPGYREARYREAADAVAAAIRRIDADIIVLTEVARVPKRDGNFVSPNDLTLLHDRLREDWPHLAYGDSADSFTHQNVAVLSKRPYRAGSLVQRIPGREGYFAELDDVDSERETTMTKGFSVEVLMDGQPVRIYAIHLKSERGGHEADAQRIAQASIVRRNYLADLQAKRHVIVAGDLNDDRGQPTLQRIRGLDDLWEDLVQTGGPAFFRQRGSETPEDFNARLRDHYTYEYNGRRQQIDHILISQSVRNHCTERNFRKRMAIEFLDIPDRIGSTEFRATDHRAVKLSLEFQDDHLLAE